MKSLFVVASFFAFSLNLDLCFLLRELSLLQNKRDYDPPEAKPCKKGVEHAKAVTKLPPFFKACSLNRNPSSVKSQENKPC